MTEAVPALAAGTLLATVVAFGCLMWSFAVNDTSVANVAQNSHSAKPMLYKLTATWGSHEGSMVLWVLILALWRRRGVAVRARTALRAQGAGAGGARVGGGGLLRLHPRHLGPLRPAVGRRRWKGGASIPCCRTPASPSTRRCSTSAMSAAPSPSPSPSRR